MGAAACGGRLRKQAKVLCVRVPVDLVGGVTASPLPLLSPTHPHTHVPTHPTACRRTHPHPPTRPLTHPPNHPLIHPCRQVMSSRDKIYVVTELVAGGELFDKIVAEGPMKASGVGWLAVGGWAGAPGVAAAGWVDGLGRVGSRAPSGARMPRECLRAPTTHTHHRVP